ncbi:MAG: hypothetical protein ACLFTA_01210 [Candidatus Nanohaloarchaea archaeon]
MKIGLDFDRTLFKTEEFDRFYKDQVEGLYHVENPKPTRHGVYDPELHAEICGVDLKEIWQVFEEDLSKFLYKDTDLLDKLNDHRIVIVTRGHEKFQEKKIEASGITEKIDEVVIVQEEPKDVADIDLLVDDRERELENAETPGIHLKRPEEGLKKVVEKVEELES